MLVMGPHEGSVINGVSLLSLWVMTAQCMAIQGFKKFRMSKGYPALEKIFRCNVMQCVSMITGLCYKSSISDLLKTIFWRTKKVLSKNMHSEWNKKHMKKYQFFLFMLNSSKFAPVLKYFAQLYDCMVPFF